MNHYRCKIDPVVETPDYLTLNKMENKLLTGKDFNQHYQTNKFVKLTNELENHNNYQFKTGLNVDSIPFNPLGECQPGGIYFCSFKKIPMWLYYTNKPMVYVRLVTIPDDAFVWIEEDKFKADRMILSKRQKIADLEEWKDESYCLEAVKQHYMALQYVIEQTPELCLAAVRKNGCALGYVKQQTLELCLEAVKQNGMALRYVIEQTPEIKLAAFNQLGLS